MVSDLTSKRIFISWSKDCARRIAVMLKDFIERVFHVEVFVSSASIECGENFRLRIDNELMNCCMGILVLTETNKKAEWLMFEAGVIAGNGTRKLCSINFNRSDKSLESPIAVFQAVLNLPEPGANKKDGIFSVFASINEELGAYTMDNLGIIFNYHWENFHGERDFWTAIEQVLEDSVCKNQPERSKVIRQLPFDFDHRSIINGGDRGWQCYTGITLKEVVEKFKRYLLDRLSAVDRERYLIKDHDSSDADEYFLINATRFSTFFSLVDNQDRVLLYNRAASGAKIRVDNPVIDLFGSVVFSNRSLLSKIEEYKNVLEVPIKTIETISNLIAIEENIEVYTNMPSVTAIMFGYEIKLDVDFQNSGLKDISDLQDAPVCFVPINVLLDADNLKAALKGQGLSSKLEAYLFYLERNK